MKRILVVVCAVAIGFSAITASAQVPNIGVFFDENLQFMWADCPPGGGLDTAYVAAHNLDMWVGSLEYAIEYPPYMTWISDIVPNLATPENPDGVLKIGMSPVGMGGIGIVYPIPRNGFVGLLTQLILFNWNCDGCDPGPPPGMDYQQVLVVSPPYGALRAVRWPDSFEVPMVGMASDICSGVIPVQENTWGGIKALYR